MPVDTVIPRLQTICASVAGVTRAYDRLPPALNSADLPSFVVMAGEATQQKLTAQGVTEERLYTLVLYVKPLSLDTFAEALNTCRPFFRLVQARFEAAYQLDSLAGVHWAHIESDSGATPLVYGRVEYAGIEFKLRVKETYAATVDK
jgi:hypothetical protein